LNCDGNIARKVSAWLCYTSHDKLTTLKTDMIIPTIKFAFRRFIGHLVLGERYEFKGYFYNEHGQKCSYWVVRHEQRRHRSVPYYAGVEEGPVRNGKMHGNWIARDADGGVREGPFVSGKRNGQWVFRSPDGSVYEGPMVNDKMNGHWVEQYADGSVWEGPYVDEKRHGQWVERFADGAINEVSYVDDKKHGQWIVRKPDGTETEVNWRNGEIVE